MLPTGSDEVVINDNMNLPNNLTSGIYDFVDTLKVKKTNYRLPLALAIQGRQPDGSYKLGTVSIQKQKK